MGAEGREAAGIRFKENWRVKDREETEQKCKSVEETDNQAPDILDEIEVEDFAVDGICGVY
jgi:mycofactocin precursor